MKKLHFELIHPPSDKIVDISDEVFSGLTTKEIQEYKESILLFPKNELNWKINVATNSMGNEYTEMSVSFIDYKNWYEHYSPQLFAGWVTTYDAWLYDHNRIGKEDFYLLFPTLPASAIGNPDFVFKEFEDKKSIDYRIMKSFYEHGYNLSCAFLRLYMKEEEE